MGTKDRREKYTILPEATFPPPTLPSLRLAPPVRHHPSDPPDCSCHQPRPVADVVGAGLMRIGGLIVAVCIAVFFAAAAAAI